MAKLSLDLSDDLAQLADNFDRLSRCVSIMDETVAQELVRILRGLHCAACALENEVSMHRWNTAARRERAQEMHRILDEATRPGTNVKLFPIIHRPIVGGRPHGAA